MLLKTGKQKNKPSKNIFQLLVQFLPSSGILLCFSQKKTPPWYFGLSIKAHANENASKTTTVAKILPVSKKYCDAAQDAFLSFH